LCTLGVGAFGRVQLVVQADTNTSYALKVLDRQYIVEMQQQTHIANERAILAECDCDFIVR
jgi:cGMP-dependent protein kinase